MKKKFLFAAGILLTVSLWAQQFPFQNPDLSSGERAKDLISRLTLEEKALLMCDQSDAIPRLGIKKNSKSRRNNEKGMSIFLMAYDLLIQELYEYKFYLSSFVQNMLRHII